MKLKCYHSKEMQCVSLVNAVLVTWSFSSLALSSAQEADVSAESEVVYSCATTGNDISEVNPITGDTLVKSFIYTPSSDIDGDGDMEGGIELKVGVGCYGDCKAWICWNGVYGFGDSYLSNGQSVVSSCDDFSPDITGFVERGGTTQYATISGCP